MNYKDKLPLHDTDKEDLQSYIETTMNTLSMKKQNKSIIKESLNSIKNILEGATGNVLATQFRSHVQRIIESNFLKIIKVDK